ncbi:MAG: serine hydrolase [Desulfobulbaceae bacterium]|nr:serine hydrolase [Desulfobulbaceae bacterium]
MNLSFYKRIAAVSAFLLVSFALTGCTFDLNSIGIKKVPQDLQETATFSPDINKKLEMAMTEGMLLNKTPGALVGIWSPKGNWVHAQGYADLKTGRLANVNDLFRIASLTKTFTANAVLILADQGKLNLDDKLSKYVAGIKNGDKITIRQVLNMTAGIYDFTYDDQFSKDFYDNPTMAFTSDDLLKVLNRHKPDFVPGKQYKYSNTNYWLLGMVIEKVTGQKADDYITENVIKPSGLKNTIFPKDATVPEKAMRGYTIKNWRLQDISEVNPAIPWTAGIMISDLQDLKTWVKSNAEGKLLSPQMQAEHIKWVSDQEHPGKIGYGAGLMNIQGFIGHAGQIFGYVTFIGYMPEKDMTMVLAVNNGEAEQGNPNTMLTLIYKALAEANLLDK